ncbi:hypothetical protein CyaNS01_01216 [Cyanobium sp. NS01]|nr:hypothetical protein CyaNS01_01216 [Cyanobium sp. NS01]
MSDCHHGLLFVTIDHGGSEGIAGYTLNNCISMKSSCIGA